MNLWRFAGVKCVRILGCKANAIYGFGWWTKIRTTDVGHVSSEGVLIKYTEFIFNLSIRGLGVET